MTREGRERPAGPLTPFLRLRDDLTAARRGREATWLALSDAMDEAVLELSDPGPDMAVVATGGYGRRQLCLRSDIDLMLVVAEPISAAPPVFRALWDAGLAVGHAIRTPRQAREAAVERTETYCSLLDARLIGGSPEVFADLQQAVAGAVRPARLRQVLIEEEQERRRAEPHHLQAADLKRSRGGLRALHAIRWLAAVGQTDGVDIEPHESALLEARQALHAVTGRTSDVMEFSLRAPAAAWAERETMEFLRELFSTRRAVDRIVGHALGVDVFSESSGGVGGRVFQAVRTRLRAHTPETDNPWQIAARAVERDPAHPRLTPEEHLALTASDENPWTEAARDAFVRLAGAGPGGRRVFDDLAAAGFLDRWMPEWTRVISQPQLDPFHLHPVDDHLWRTAAEAVRLVSSDDEEPWARDIAEELGSLDEVVLACLFHDIGKGTGRDHSEAGAEIVDAFARRAGFGGVTVDVVTTLVRRHLLLPQVATRHDLNDPDVIDDVAGAIGDADVLRMLYLLTIADATATGPDVWTPWRASLIRTLFIRAVDVLESDRSRAAPLRTARIDELTRDLAEDVAADTITAHLAAMPDTYTLRTAAPEVRRHLLLLQPPPVGTEVRIDVVEEEEWSDVVIVTPDRPGLLAVASGVMALSNISILEARLATRADGVVVDRFHVIDSLLGGAVDPGRWDAVLADLRTALEGELDLEARLTAKHHDYRALVDTTVSPDVRILDGPHGTGTRIELRCADRVGLLHDVAKTLHGHEVDVSYAKIDTQGDRVVDSFHVVVPAGLDLDRLQIDIAAAATVPPP